MTLHPKDPTQEYDNATSMQAIGMTQVPKIGAVADALEMLTVPVPRPATGEVAIQIAASAMHIDEIYAAQGTALGRFYGPKNVSKSNPALLGSCATGKIVGLGKSARNFEIGDEIIVIPSEHPQAASWATYQCFEEKWIMHKPPELTHVEAAAATMASCVAWGAIGFAKPGPGDRCLIVGASGAIGVMIMQFLKSLECHVTAVCSGASASFSSAYGADAHVDYSQMDFADHATSNGIEYDLVFDCVGGQEIEACAFRSLKKSGAFLTVVGPKQYIGQEKLSWLALARVIGHIALRFAVTRLNGGPKVLLWREIPRLVVAEAMAQLLKHNIRMPVLEAIPFAHDPVKNAVEKLVTHREKGRTVIDFEL